MELNLQAMGQAVFYRDKFGNRIWETSLTVGDLIIVSAQDFSWTSFFCTLIGLQGFELGFGLGLVNND